MTPIMTATTDARPSNRAHMAYPPRRDRRDGDPRANCRRNPQRRKHDDQNGGLTGEFAALGSLFTAGYLFLLIL